MKKNTEEVQWLAGGCILHHRENLIIDDFFPFSGKAYCEDLIHSTLLRNNNVRMWVTKNVVCELDSLVENETVIQKLQEKIAIEYTLHLTKGSSIRYVLRNTYFSIKYRIKSILK